MATLKSQLQGYIFPSQEVARVSPGRGPMGVNSDTSASNEVRFRNRPLDGALEAAGRARGSSWGGRVDP